MPKLISVDNNGSDNKRKRIQETTSGLVDIDAIDEKKKLNMMQPDTSSVLVDINAIDEKKKQNMMQTDTSSVLVDDSDEKKKKKKKKMMMQQETKCGIVEKILNMPPETSVSIVEEKTSDDEIQEASSDDSDDGKKKKKMMQQETKYGIVEKILDMPPETSVSIVEEKTSDDEIQEASSDDSDDEKQEITSSDDNDDEKQEIELEMLFDDSDDAKQEIPSSDDYDDEKQEIESLTLFGDSDENQEIESLTLFGDSDDENQEITSSDDYYGDEKQEIGSENVSDDNDDEKQEIESETSSYDRNDDKQEIESETSSDGRNDAKQVYIGAAFRSKCPNEVFFFIGYEYVVVNYDPSMAANDFIVKPPRYILKGFPRLNRAVDAAFSCHDGYQAYLFHNNLCAHIEYEHDDTRRAKVFNNHFTRIIFPCLKGTNFEKRVDAAFESTTIGQAYLFSKTQYGLLNYINGTLIATGSIIDEFPCLKNTMFERGIGAAFASHTPNEAYLFKDNNYVRFYFTPGEPNKSYIIEGSLEIIPTNWPSLESLLTYDMSYELDAFELEDESPELEQLAYEHLTDWEKGYDISSQAFFNRMLYG